LTRALLVHHRAPVRESGPWQGCVEHRPYQMPTEPRSPPARRVPSPVREGFLGGGQWHRRSPAAAEAPTHFSPSKYDSPPKAGFMRDRSGRRPVKPRGSVFSVVQDILVDSPPRVSPSRARTTKPGRQPLGPLASANVPFSQLLSRVRQSPW